MLQQISNLSRKYFKNNAGKIAQALKHKGSWIGTKSRDILTKAKHADVSFSSARIGFKASRERLKKNAKSALTQEQIHRFTNHGRRLIEGTKAGQILTKMSDKPWVRRTAFIGAGLGALNMVEKTLSNFSQGPVIPDHYNKGYDLMKETYTDFGSPLHLAKTASKTLNPYYSTVRKALKTTTKTVTNKNIALALSKNAINHTRY